MGRPTGTKNNMRTPEEKEKIILEYFDSGKGAIEFSRYIGIDRKQLWKWIKKDIEQGIDGLKSRTGKCAKKGIVGRPKKVETREEELADYTAGGESHPAPKNIKFRFILYHIICFVKCFLVYEHITIILNS